MELVARLQEVEKFMKQETTQLVDAIMNLTIDQEETDKAIARMSIEANLRQAKVDEQAQTISDLRSEVKTEREKRQKLETEARKAVEKLEALGNDLKNIKSQSDNEEADSRAGSDSPDELVRVGESASYRGSPVAKRQQALPNGKRAKGTPAARTLNQQPRSSQPMGEEQVLEPQKEEVASQSPLNESARTPVPTSRDALVTHSGSGQQAIRPSHDDHGSGGHVRVSNGFQGVAGNSTLVTPPKFGPLSMGPPRAPAAMSQERRWGNRSSSGRGNNFSSGPSFGQTPRKNGFQPLPRYAPNGQYNSPHDRPGSVFGQQRRETYPSTPTSSNRNRYGRLADTPQPAMTPSNGIHYGTSGMTPSSAVVGRGGNVVESPIHVTEQAIAAWNEQIIDFYGAIRVFVGRHAGEADQSGELAAQLSQSSLWPVLMTTYRPLNEAEAASYLDFHLQNENTKACVVTRVIIDYVVNRVWVPSAWAGSDPQTAQELATVQPLLNRFAGAHESRRDLERVAEAAWDLSARILASRLTFDFRFPDIGARFSCQSMLPIWPHADPAELQAKHWRVAFVTTPVITCRNDTGTGISAHSVTLADVFCMQ
ncbi:hypothetical protein HIM_00171 [Hirsutella minnesotensis 3608]|nr:hypothetical protein HIM_00171 [Hirsutella minnesotensis 3608]